MSCHDTIHVTCHIKHLASKTYHLRLLLKKDTEWIWKDIHSKEIQELKTCISEETCLKYYNRKLDINLEVDASQLGLGAALIQSEQNTHRLPI